MKLVFLTQYFPPEIGAPQTRLFELARGLKKRGHEITVLTAFPNYPTGKIFPGYKLRPVMEEELAGLRVIRTCIYPSHSKSFLKRLFNYFSFVFSSLFLGIFKLKKHDVLVCETPPLFLGISALILSRIKGAGLYLYVSDLWPASAVELKYLTNPLAIKLSKILEKWLYRVSKKIIAITPGMKKILEAEEEAKGKIELITNGADTEIFSRSDKKAARAAYNFPQDAFIVMYAGTHGSVYNLKIIIDCACALKNEKELLFVFAGGGVEKQGLMRYAGEKGALNVVFLEPVSISKMPLLLSAADAGILSINQTEFFRMTIPAKMTEMMAMEIPLIVAMEGDSENIIRASGGGIAIKPGDLEEMKEAILALMKNRENAEKMGVKARAYVIKYFSRKEIIEKFEGLL